MTPAALLLRPGGALDAETCAGLRQQLATAFATGVQSIAVDLSNVSHVDVIGLQVLAGAARHLRKRGGLLLVSAASPEVTTLLRVNGLADLLEVPASNPLRVIAGDGQQVGDAVPADRRSRVATPKPA